MSGGGRPRSLASIDLISNDRAIQKNRRMQTICRCPEMSELDVDLVATNLEHVSPGW